MNLPSPRHFLAVAIALAGCASRSAAPALPPEVEGGWRLTRSVSREIASAPEPARSLGVTAVWEAAYQGPFPVRVQVYEMKGQAAAFELIQKWRPESGTVYFQRDALFLLVESAGAGREPLNRFADALERALKKGGSRSGAGSG